MSKQAKRNIVREGSLYPPPSASESEVLLRVPGADLSTLDKVMVTASSLFCIGSIAWVPLLFRWLWRKWKKTKDSSRRALYATILIALLGLKIVGPHRHPSVGALLRFKSWGLWKSWLRYMALEVVADNPAAKHKLLQEKQAILAISPHGLFPFALGFAALPEQTLQVFGYFRPVVATATNLFPFVNTILKWLFAVDASRSSVDQALRNGDRIGVAPGGIAEMFEGFPKPGTHPDNEYIISKRQGFIKLAVEHGLPIVPVYCFGASKMLKRLQLPNIVEKLSKVLRMSIIIFFGAWGLPIPFRQRLLYTVGEPIYPSYVEEGTAKPSDPIILQRQVTDMHEKYCKSLESMFDRHKTSYGWGHKTLKLI